MGRPSSSLRNVAALLREPRQMVERTRRLELEDLIQSLDNNVSGIDASEIAYDNSVSGLSAVTVQGALNEIASDSPDYTLSNVTTARTLDADAAAGAISATPTQAEVEALRDAVLQLADVVGTLAADLQGKKVLGEP
jgi:hypothetical protein